jgi:hypothetical protein
LRLALARESGWRGPSAIDAAKTRLERIQYEESSPDSPTRPSYNEERQRNKRNEATKIIYLSAKQ